MLGSARARRPIDSIMKAQLEAGLGFNWNNAIFAKGDVFGIHGIEPFLYCNSSCESPTTSFQDVSNRDPTPPELMNVA